jgi:hypothetical protein
MKTRIIAGAAFLVVFPAIALATAPAADTPVTNFKATADSLADQYLSQTPAPTTDANLVAFLSSQGVSASSPIVVEAKKRVDATLTAESNLKTEGVTQGSPAYNMGLREALGEPLSPTPAPAPTNANAAQPPGTGNQGTPVAQPSSNAPTSGTTSPVQTTPAASTILPNVSIKTSDNLNLVTTTLFSGTINTFGKFPGLTLSATAATSKPTSASSTRYSDVQMLIPEGAALGLYLSPFNSDVPNKVQDTDTPFADRRQVVDRYYFNYNKPPIVSTLDPNKKINEIDDPITLFYVRDGVGAKMVNRSQDPTVESTGTAPSSSSTQTSSTADYGIAASAFLGLGADGGLLADSKTAGAFRIEGLITATWADKQSVLTLYPNSPKSPQDAIFGAYAHFSLSLNSNIKLDVQYAVPFGYSKAYVNKAVLFGATVSR